MKRIIIAAAVIAFAACKGGAGKTEDTTKDTFQNIVNGGGTVIDSANESGKRLIAANDCLTCHQINFKSFGPAYVEIAKRYDENQGNIENLAYRIIKGGRGLWGQNAMTPHPNVSFPQAQEMVRYIFTLRNATDTAK